MIRRDWLDPWRKLPRTMLFYAVAGVVGALILATLHALFSPA